MVEATFSTCSECVSRQYENTGQGRWIAVDDEADKDGFEEVDDDQENVKRCPLLTRLGGGGLWAPP